MTTQEGKPDSLIEFEKILDRYLYVNIGLLPASNNNCPMDKGECKYMLKKMYEDYVLPLQQQLSSLQQGSCKKIL